MYSNEDIESAVAAKIISRQAAQALRDHVAGVKKTSAVDEENFRLLTGFNAPRYTQVRNALYAKD